MREGTIRPTREKILSLQQLIGSFYRNQYLPAHKWRSFIGTLTSLEKFIPLGRLHIRPFQWLLADPCPPSHKEGTELVVPDSQPSCRSSLGSPGTQSQDLHGCLTPGLGCPLWGHHLSRCLVSPRVFSSHKCPGTQGHSPCLGPVFHPFRQSCLGCLGQFHCSGICQQTGRNQIPSTLGGDQVPVPSDHISTDLNPSPSHCGSPQCDRGPTLKGRPSSPDRMVPQSGISRHHLPFLGSPSGRSVLNQVQPQMSPVRVSSSGSPGLADRRPGDQLGGSFRLRIPPTCDHATSPIKVFSDQQVQVDLDRSPVAKPVMVPTTGNPILPRSDQDPSHQDHAQTTEIQDVPSQSGAVKPSRVAASQAVLKVKGSSKAARQRITAPQA